MYADLSIQADLLKAVLEKGKSAIRCLAGECMYLPLFKAETLSAI
jgi:hypothetical protein